MRGAKLRSTATMLWRLSLLDATAPQGCAACGAWIAAGEGAVCTPCRAALQKTAGILYCPFCGRSVASTVIHEKNCAFCAKERFWNVAGVARVGEYREGALRQLLLGLKFGGGERQAAVLGELLGEALSMRGWMGEIEAFIPVPMHILRRVQRSSNHAKLLAEAVGKRLGIPVRSAVVRRRKYARSQTRVRSMAERFRNIKDCFAPAHRTGIEGKTVCIVDNLLVTGATIHEVSKVLRRAGAKRIYAAVAARSRTI